MISRIFKEKDRGDKEGEERIRFEEEQKFKFQ